MSNEKNKKDLLTAEHIMSDLLSEEKDRFIDSATWIPVVTLPAGGVISIFGVILRSSLIGIFLAVVVLCMAGVWFGYYRRSRKRRKMVADGNYTVTTEKLCNVMEDADRDDLLTRSRCVWYLFFPSMKWKIPMFNFGWSERYHMSCEGVVNTSIIDDEFYVVLFNDTYEIGYAYPKKFFEWEGERTD